MPKKKVETVSLIDTFAEFKETKNIDRATLVGVLEESFHNVLAKIFGSDENFDIIINPDKGDCEIYRNRVVVADGEVKDDNKEICLTDAQRIDEDYEVGEDVSEPIDFTAFGRRAILTLRQTLAGKVLELEHDSLYNKYKDRVGEVIGAEVYQIWKSEMLLLDEEGNELILPKSQQIPGDFYHKGDILRAVIDKVEMLNNSPKIYLSRTAPAFLQRLLEAEVPEINDGLITIKGIARVPGERAKVAVESYDDRIDPVGACVGVKGRRVHGIVRELRNENIDVVNYTSNISLYIQRALSPAKVSNVYLDDVAKKAEVYLQPKEVSLAIVLTGYLIDVYRESEEDNVLDDIYLEEFDDEIDQWIIDTLKGVGMKTARDVLGTPREELIAKTDLEEETIDRVLRILNEEFEKE